MLYWPGTADTGAKNEMRNKWGWLIFLLAVLAIFPALGEDNAALAPYPLPENMTRALPRLEESGFLAPGEAPYTYASREEGLWLYIDETLRVEIHRMADAGIPLVWFESYVSCRGEEALQTYQAGSGKSESHFKMPDQLAREAGFVFATSDDFYGYRVLNQYKLGTLIRDGVVISDQQSPYSDQRFPAMDILAVYPDGRLKTYLSDGVTAGELLAEGVETAFCFGPVLVRDGEIDPRVEKGGIYTDLEPRHALGMIAPGRYVFLTALGRRSDSRGTGLRWMARKMRDLGAVEAFNLDGGNSLSLIFQGEIINRAPGNTNNRPITSLIGFGQMENAAK